MNGVDRANLDVLVRMAQGDRRAVWDLLEWMATHLDSATLAYNEHSQDWTCCVLLDRVLRSVASPVAHQAVIAAARQVLQEGG